MLTRRGPHGPERSAGDPDPSLHRVVTFRLADAEVVLLRSLAWIAERRVVVGGTVFLNLPEMGVEGPAEVLSVGPCPDFEPVPDGADPRDWRIVTGTFRHAAGRAYDLRVDTEPDPLGVTASHPFWSHDRNDWIAAGELRIGETLRTADGFARVRGRTLRATAEPVYNLEVHADHAYRVGHSAILVHNQSPNDGPYIGKNCDPCKKARRVNGEQVEGVEAGTWYTVSYEGFLGRTQQPKVCRVHSIKGPILDPEKERSSKGQKAMRNLIFGTTNQTQMQKDLKGRYEAGHLIADSLNGPPDVRNLVPMVGKDFNKSYGSWFQMEEYLRQCVRHACFESGTMSVRTAYNADADGIRKYIPKSFKVSVTVCKKSGDPKCRSAKADFENVADVTTPDFVQSDKLKCKEE